MMRRSWVGWVSRSFVIAAVGISASSTFGLATQAPVGQMSPTNALVRAYSSNPQIAAADAGWQAEAHLIRSKYFLSDPKVGWMRGSNMNNMQIQMGPMDSWTVSQEFLFPLKYFAMGAAQGARADAASQAFLDKKLEIRQQVLSSYYGLYSAGRILSLLEAQKETLREISRIAESRRATGAAPQQDEMKAHVEQTRIEAEIILQKQEVVELKSTLIALLDFEATDKFSLPSEELPIPKLLPPDHLIQTAMTKSYSVRKSQALVSEAQSEKANAYYGYFPNFSINYQRAYANTSGSVPSNAYAIGIQMSVPLWFLMKQSSEAAYASSKALEAQKNLEAAQRNVQAEAQASESKVEALSQLLKIYETALIPQATSALESSRSAYTAGKVGFQELLDAERVLYGTRILFYQTLSRFVQSVTRLEHVSGTLMSSLPYGDLQ